MNTTHYNKLIRDRIPEIIESGGGVAYYHIATDEEYREMLQAKLIEEVGEFLEEPSPEEMGDILEVLESLSKLFEFKMKDARLAQRKKSLERGGFSERIILDKVATNEPST